MQTQPDVAGGTVRLSVGEPAPWFVQRSPDNPAFHFSNAAGRHIVLCFIDSSNSGQGARATAAVAAHRGLFDDRHASLFYVSSDPEDETTGRLRNQVPGLRAFYDSDGRVAALYGQGPADADAPGCWMVLDPGLRITRITPFAPDGSEAAAVMAYVASRPAPGMMGDLELRAPVLFLPDIFEAELCRELIGRYEAAGGAESGFMRERDGRTVHVADERHKRRRDHLLTHAPTIEAVRERIARRIAPEIARAFQFGVTRMERYLVGCYAAEDGGHFNPHRDNTTRGTAHRRFAVSINLNDGYDGGEVRFPEYGPRGYKPPPGGAIVFSCSLLHAVSKVTAGRRYAFLPFLYDDAAAALRDRNKGFVDA